MHDYIGSCAHHAYTHTYINIQTQEIAALVAFVADNPSMNGSVLHANGGQKET